MAAAGVVAEALADDGGVVDVGGLAGVAAAAAAAASAFRNAANAGLEANTDNRLTTGCGGDAGDGFTPAVVFAAFAVVAVVVAVAVAVTPLVRVDGAAVTVVGAGWLVSLAPTLARQRSATEARTAGTTAGFEAV